MPDFQKLVNPLTWLVLRLDLGQSDNGHTHLSGVSMDVFLRLPFFDKMSSMETVEYFSGFLRKIGAPNFLAIGIVLIVLWLLISGLRKGLRKGKNSKESEKKNDES